MDPSLPSLAPDAAGPERAPRTQLYFAAGLRHGSALQTVRVRNLSTAGAMVESDEPLPTGLTVTLERGPLTVEAVVIWSEGRRSGLRFAEPVSVRAWMGLAGPVAGRGSPTSGTSVANKAENVVATTDLALALLLAEQLDEALAEDGDAAARHGQSLQSLDLLVQMLTELTAQSAGRAARLDHIRDAARAAVRRRP